MYEQAGHFHSKVADEVNLIITVSTGESQHKLNYVREDHTHQF